MEPTWIAEYKDGTYLLQHDKVKINNFFDIDRKNLKSFLLCKREKDNTIPLIKINLEPGQRLVYRRRVLMRSDGYQEVMYLIGWQQIIEGKNIQSILCYFEDGSIEMIGKWDEKRYSPEFNDVEMIATG